MSTTVDLGKITASVTVGTTTTGAAGTNASVSNSGTTQDAVLNFTIPRGAQGVQGPQGIQGNTGPAGPTGPQGPMGDVAVITPEQQAAFTMYSVPGQHTNGPMTQKAVTDALVAGSISYDNSQSGLAAENVQVALDEVAKSTENPIEEEIPLAAFKGYYSISNNVISLKNTYDNNFRYVDPININGYSKVKILFYMDNTYLAKTAFADDSGNVKGNVLSNTTLDYVTFDVPEGSTKLYISSRSATLNNISVIGIVNGSVKDNKNNIGNDDYLLSIRTTSQAFLGSYYTYNNGVSTASGANNCRAYIDLDANYKHIKIKANCPSTFDCRSFFVDSNDTLISYINPSLEGKIFEIPESAKRLYISSASTYGIQAYYALQQYENTIKQRLDDIEDTIGQINNKVNVNFNIIIKKYYIYSDNTPKQESNNNFVCCVVNVSDYDYLTLRFICPSSYGAKSFFVDDNNTFKGYIYSNGEEITVQVPSGATKLYISSQLLFMYVVGIKGSNKSIKDEIDSIKTNINIGPTQFLQNISWRYGYDATARAGYYIIRINKKRLDGTNQYPFALHVNPVNTAQGVANSKGFYFVMNCSVGSGQLIENGVSINNTPSVLHTGALVLTIDSNGNLGYNSDPNVDTATLIAQGIVSACVGFCPIVDNYQPLNPPSITNTEHFTQRRQRQIIGQYGNGDYCVITCEGKDSSGTEFDNSAGFTLVEARALCVANNLKFAYFCDGGGSTETVIMKKQLNLVYEGTTGRTRDMFIVFNGSTVFTRSQE